MAEETAGQETWLDSLQEARLSGCAGSHEEAHMETCLGARIYSNLADPIWFQSVKFKVSGN